MGECARVSDVYAVSDSFQECFDLFICDSHAVMVAKPRKLAAESLAITIRMMLR